MKLLDAGGTLYGMEIMSDGSLEIYPDASHFDTYSFDIVVENKGGTETQAYSPDTVISSFTFTTVCGPSSTTLSAPIS